MAGFIDPKVIHAAAAFRSPIGWGTRDGCVRRDSGRVRDNGLTHETMVPRGRGISSRNAIYRDGVLRTADRGSTAMCANESSLPSKGEAVNSDTMICCISDDI